MPLLAWNLEPLPDFLADHTLVGTQVSERLREHCARWVQFVASLWPWRDRAGFALRFLARQGQTRVYFLAAARQSNEDARLSNDVELLFRAHRLAADPARVRLTQQRLALETDLAKPVSLEVTQAETRSLWKLPEHVMENDHYRSKYHWLTPQEWQQPRVIYPWWGPGGPFLIPMESLITQPVAVALTIYLEPTELRPAESEWMALMAREAQSLGDQSVQQIGSVSVKVVDPTAQLAGRLYMANLRRLSVAPFLVAVHCTAAEGRLDVARGLAGAIQALVHEPPFERPQQEDQRLPSGAALHGENPERSRPGFQDAASQQYRGLHFPAALPNGALGRIPYLVDAQGAGTVFRLPVSVRGGVPGIQVKQLPPDFHPGVRTLELPPGHIELGRYHAGGAAYFPLRDLTKHALITGFTGSGKTVTVMQILHQVWVNHGVPFLVLESAKQEYRGLISVEAMRQRSPLPRVYTLGNEMAAPFRLNPFALLPGVRVEAHVSKLQTCFEGAIPPIGPSSSVINEALIGVYGECGWSLTDSYPMRGTAQRRFPVLGQFVKTIERVLKDRGYEGEISHNLRAALVGRFQPLLLGGKGRMFDTQQCSPSLPELFRSPVVLEMNDLNLEDKALMVMFLLTLLREYRELDRSQQGELKHLTVVEEAHNVLEQVSSVGGGEGATSADTRYKAVQAFCSLLTEIRALGEGLIIADQSPQKLAADAVRNTNLQIAHQLRDSKDRETIAHAMIMENEQRDYLGKLPPGNAALFRTGLEKATFIVVPKYYPDAGDIPSVDATLDKAQRQDLAKRFRGFGFNRTLSDGALIMYMERADPAVARHRRPMTPFPECEFCTVACRYRDSMFTELRKAEVRANGAQWLLLTSPTYRAKERISVDQMWSRLLDMAAAVMKGHQLVLTQEGAWCFFIHLWDQASRDAGFNRGEPDRVLEVRQWDLFRNHFARRFHSATALPTVMAWANTQQAAAHSLERGPFLIGAGTKAHLKLPKTSNEPDILLSLSFAQGQVLLENMTSGAKQPLQHGSRITMADFVVEIVWLQSKPR